jgi:ketosteroid isomerase-like protein
MTDHAPVRLAEDPTNHVAAYCETFARRSGELLDRHYEADANHVPPPRHPLREASQRIDAHNYLLGHGLPIEAQPRHIYVADDVALLIVDWSIRGTARGQAIDLHGVATDVARRGSDGRWRYVIDNPFGIG